MTGAERFAALLAAIIAAGGGIGGGLGLAARGLWRIKGAWDATNGELRGLARDVRALVAANERDHRRLDDRDDRIEARLDRHEQRHAGRGR